MDNGHIKGSKILFRAARVKEFFSLSFCLIELIKFHSCPRAPRLWALANNGQTEGNNVCLPPHHPPMQTPPTLSGGFLLPSFFLIPDITDTWHSSYLDNGGRASLLRLRFPQGEENKGSRGEKGPCGSSFLK